MLRCFFYLTNLLAYDKNDGPLPSDFAEVLLALVVTRVLRLKLFSLIWYFTSMARLFIAAVIFTYFFSNVACNCFSRTPRVSKNFIKSSSCGIILVYTWLLLWLVPLLWYCSIPKHCLNLSSSRWLSDPHPPWKIHVTQRGLHCRY